MNKMLALSFELWLRLRVFFYMLLDDDDDDDDDDDADEFILWYGWPAKGV